MMRVGFSLVSGVAVGVQGLQIQAIQPAGAATLSDPPAVDDPRYDVPRFLKTRCGEKFCEFRAFQEQNIKEVEAKGHELYRSFLREIKYQLKNLERNGHKIQLREMLNGAQGLPASARHQILIDVLERLQTAIGESEDPELKFWLECVEEAAKCNIEVCKRIEKAVVHFKNRVYDSFEQLKLVVQTVAVTRLQKLFRGHSARKQARDMKLALTRIGEHSTASTRGAHISSTEISLLTKFMEHAEQHKEKYFAAACLVGGIVLASKCK